MISSLLQNVGMRPRVYYPLTNFRGGQGPMPPPPPLNTQTLQTYLFYKYYKNLSVTLYSHNFLACARLGIHDALVEADDSQRSLGCVLIYTRTALCRSREGTDAG